MIWRPILTVVAWLLYLVAFSGLQPVLGVNVGLLALAPVLLTAWFWGRWGGFIASLVAISVTLSLWYYQFESSAQIFADSRARVLEIVLFLLAGNLMGFASSVYKQLATQRRVSHQAQYDVLTGLLNRKSFEETLATMIVGAKQRDTLLAVLFVDLDKFKQVNDLYGHDIGDELLKVVARHLRSSVRDGDAVARLGGDEFMIVLSGLREPEAATLVADKIVRVLNNPFRIRGKELHISASVGISIFPDDGGDVETLVKSADTTMYAVKAEGKNHYKIKSADTRIEESQRQELEKMLSQALERHEYELFFQPQVELRSHQVLGFEVLLRWRSPELGLLTPTDFWVVAEQSGLLPTLSHWVLREACHQLGAWQRVGYRPFKLIVNIAAQHFVQKDFVAHVERAVRENGLKSRWLELEFAERTLAFDPKDTETTLQKLEQLGVGIVLDDFGTSLSSIVNLQRFPISALKVDGKFTRRLGELSGEGQTDALLIEAICTLGQKFGKQVIAEGIEVRPQHDAVLALGCYAAQGFYYAKPMSAKDVELMLDKWKKAELAGQK
ncbi:MAG: putative bifunctional diguanylate cyclase/phosphodiesterase [Trueperaceae bacterium]